jgi:uncharacterized membrane protein YkoI
MKLVTLKNGGEGGRRRQEPLSIVDAIWLAQAQLGGIVTEAELEQHNGHPVWGVGIITPDGKSRKVIVDSATGRLLPAKHR